MKIFIKFRYEIGRNADTICGKGTLFHRSYERWQPSADTLKYALFLGIKTVSLSNAWNVAISLTPKSFATWRLKRTPNRNPARKTPEARRSMAHLNDGDCPRLAACVKWRGWPVYLTPCPLAA